MRIGMIGLGKLGLPVALAINSRGHAVFGFDVNPDVKTYLDQRAIPFREEGIEPLLASHTVMWCDSIESLLAQDCDIVFVAIQTPHQPEFEGDNILPDERADFDYTALKKAIKAVNRAVESHDVDPVVAVISTCLPGTFKREIDPLVTEFEYAYTPQFIAMGTVIHDYLSPEFNLIGTKNADAARTLSQFYETINDAPPLVTDITTAEGIKVSYNTWITAKTVIANAWGEMSEKLGMNFDDLHLAWDLADQRIVSSRYMRAGMSDGGGCHPRDNIALSWLAERIGMSHNIWEDLMEAREDYEMWHCEVAIDASVKNKLPIVLLGRAFKPETDIETGSPAMLMANVFRTVGVQFLHANDLDYLPPAVYFIATKNDRYADYAFPPGSVVLDPFGFIADRDGVEVVRIGRKR
ncbi:hypothetical protein JRC04_04885 [Mycolicibacterium sp. S2-37]|uniref:NAD(P)-binding domain-containing protein n=1 Tax=Mycolicibacterium sp. S2-37 TaxID=2810297 RepID=UPI001A94E27E|nr:NAD(P)-binding domain-containing protein [Mycolicibacterium sp. S2-37]MBO0676795.1 hypothetical protein [Mycolicibacterium sp. S2-37]